MPSGSSLLSHLWARLVSQFSHQLTWSYPHPQQHHNTTYVARAARDLKEAINKAIRLCCRASKDPASTTAKGDTAPQKQVTQRASQAIPCKVGTISSSIPRTGRLLAAIRLAPP